MCCESQFKLINERYNTHKQNTHATSKEPHRCATLHWHATSPTDAPAPDMPPTLPTPDWLTAPVPDCINTATNEPGFAEYLVFAFPVWMQMNIEGNLLVHVFQEGAAKSNTLDPNVVLQMYSPILMSQKAMIGKLHNAYHSITCENGVSLVFAQVRTKGYRALFCVTRAGFVFWLCDWKRSSHGESRCAIVVGRNPKTHWSRALASALSNRVSNCDFVRARTLKSTLQFPASDWHLHSCDRTGENLAGIYEEEAARDSALPQFPLRSCSQWVSKTQMRILFHWSKE